MKYNFFIVNITDLSTHIVYCFHLYIQSGALKFKHALVAV